MSRKNLTIIILLLAAVVAVAVFWKEGTPEVDTPVIHVESSVDPDNLSEPNYTNYENVVVPPSLDNKEIDYTGFTVGFNASKHQPNYVAWVLTPDHLDGPYTRKGVNFMQDPNVEGCATLADYKGSGFDRGHMAPAADMKWSAQAMADCHYLTNMCPQDDALNSGAWATVEKNTRKWVEKHGPLVIIAGPVLSDRLTRTIGESKVPVPDRFFKVILAPEANPPMGLAFIMPNAKVEGGAQAAVASIDQVEAITGFDFFAALPDDVENQVETESSLRKWNK